MQSWEVNFGYVEQGEKKNALVKVRLCERCSERLNYKKRQKRAESHHCDSPGVTEEAGVDRKSKEANEERYSPRPKSSSSVARTTRHDRKSSLGENNEQDRKSSGTSSASRRDGSPDTYHSRTRDRHHDRRRSASKSPERKERKPTLDPQFETFFAGLFE